jgi:hypothetical protein
MGAFHGYSAKACDLLGRQDRKARLATQARPRPSGAVSYVDNPLDPKLGLDFRKYIYCGPFFISCDHGCAHSRSNHGAGLVSHGCILEDPPTPRQIFEITQHRIGRANAVFTFIGSADCHGTLVEIGFVHALGKLIGIGFSDGDLDSLINILCDLWMARTAANVGTYVGPAASCFERFQDDFAAVRRIYLALAAGG